MNNLKTFKSIAIVTLCLVSPFTFANSGTSDNGFQKAAADVSQAASDTAITTKIKGLYASEKIFGDKDISVLGISVKTINGIVYLKGKATSEDQVTNAVKIAKNVKGVKRVVFNLKVNTLS